MDPVSKAVPGEPVWWDERTWAHIEQSRRAVTARQWAAQKRAAATDMRLQAISMREHARAMRTAGLPDTAPCGPDSPEVVVQQRVQAAVVIEQAKGVLAARFACTVEQAGRLLQEHCRRTGQLAAVLAHQVVHHRILEP
ncbi:ANTAR domain-containing protein [Streptomyces sp. NPDC016845]|uniref:ANTAR domain-containing protein n=1 Tax=Streptomyces sp. NPDC016845 TaxID=3364972 RepID=UPI00378D79EB